MNETRKWYKAAINALLQGIARHTYQGADAAVAAGAVETLARAYNVAPDVFVEDDDDGEND